MCGYMKTTDWSTCRGTLALPGGWRSLPWIWVTIGSIGWHMVRFSWSNAVLIILLKLNIVRYNEMFKSLVIVFQSTHLKI